MINLNKWQRDLENKLASPATFENRELARLKREYDQELRKLNEALQAKEKKIKSDSEHARELIEQAALQKASWMLYQDLQTNYKSLQHARFPPSISEKEKAVIHPLVANLRKHQDKPELLETVEAMAQATLVAVDMPHLWDAVQFEILGKHQHFPVITSYIGAGKVGSQGVCYLVSPVDGEENKELASDLESRILDVAGRNVLRLSMKPVVMRTSETVEHIGTDELHFNPEMSNSNGFLWYTLTLTGESTNRFEVLRDAIIAKYNEIEQNTSLESFKKLGIQHELVPLDFRVLRYFFEHPEKDFNLPQFSVQGLHEQGISEIDYLQAAELIGSNKSGISRLVNSGKLRESSEGRISLESINSYVLNRGKIDSIVSMQTEPKEPVKYNFTSQDTEGRVQEAYSRLEKYGDNLSVHELSDVFGGMGYSGARRIASEIEGTKVIDANVRGGKQVIVPKSGLKAYLDSHTPNPNMVRWEKKE